MTIYYINQPCWNDLGYDEGYNEHSVITNSITKNTQL